MASQIRLGVASISKCATSAMGDGVCIVSHSDRLQFPNAEISIVKNATAKMARMIPTAVLSRDVRGAVPAGAVPSPSSHGRVGER